MKKNQYAENPIIIWQQQGAEVDGSTARHSKSHAFSNPGRPDHRSRVQWHCKSPHLLSPWMFSTHTHSH